MNRGFLIVGIPAVVTSFCWLAFGWGWRTAAIVTGTELVVISAGVIYLLKRGNARAQISSGGAALGAAASQPHAGDSASPQSSH